MTDELAGVHRWLDGLDVGPVPIPEHLRDRLRFRDAPGLATTRPRFLPPYRLRLYLDELDTPGPHDDYIVIGPDGHGVASRAMHYYLVSGSIAIFVQNRWGTAYEAHDAERARLARRLRSVTTILASARERLGDRRILVVASDFEGEWAELRRRDELVARIAGAGVDALAAAAAWLRENRGQTVE